MGIHVHKVLGYGLTDVAYDRYRIADPRINTDSRLLTEIWKIKPDEYRAWLEQKNGTEIGSGHLNLDQYVGRDDREPDAESRMEKR
jgi:hypothetical protein